jgi:hypothetical protein
MDEARLTEIEEDGHRDPDGFWGDVVSELITEIRRLKAMNEQAYRNGESNGLADITAIIQDPHDPNDILGEIKGYLGMGSD